MATPAIRDLIGVVDGVNTIFKTPVPYVPGSVRVFLNGQLKRSDLSDGWVELGYDEIRLHIAPDVSDVVQAYFIRL